MNIESFFAGLAIGIAVLILGMSIGYNAKADDSSVNSASGHEYGRDGD